MLYEPLIGKVIITRDAMFNEEECWSWEVDGSLMPRKFFLDPTSVSVLAGSSLTNKAIE